MLLLPMEDFGEDARPSEPTSADVYITDRSGRVVGLSMDMQQIEVYAKRIQANHVLLIFDRCFSGSIFDAVRGRPPSYIRVKTVSRYGIYYLGRCG